MLLNIICTLYVLFVIFIHLIGLFQKFVISKRQYMYVLGAFGFAYAYLASQIEPPPLWDLFHHYAEIDNMRMDGISYALTEAKYKDLFIINFLFYFVSLFNDDGLLVFLAIFIEYLIFTFITCDLKGRYDDKYNIAFSINFFVFFALVNVVLSISGIRNVLACSIAALAVYMDLFKQKKGLFKFLLYIIPIFIHPATIIVPVARLFALSKNIYKLAPLLIIWGVFSSSLSDLLKSSSVGALNIAGSLLENYGDGTYAAPYDPRLVVVNCVFVLLILACCLYMLRKKSSKFSKAELHYVTYVVVYLFIALGSLANVLIFNRMLYGFAYLILPVIPIILRSLSFQIRPLLVLPSIVFFTGMLMYQGMELYTAITYYTL